MQTHFWEYKYALYIAVRAREHAQVEDRAPKKKNDHDLFLSWASPRHTHTLVYRAQRFLFTTQKKEMCRAYQAAHACPWRVPPHTPPVLRCFVSPKTVHFVWGEKKKRSISRYKYIWMVGRTSIN